MNKNSYLRNKSDTKNRLMAGIYIHIPFCKRRCRYCAFYSSTNSTLQAQYVKALCRELESRRQYINETVETIYFGGGTPTTLSQAQLGTILDTIAKNYSISNNPEITIEANPDDLTIEKISELRTLPFNRLSIGIQSLNDARLAELGRRHTARQAIEAVKNAQDAGFNNISIDLMFALPSSTLKEWEETLAHATALCPTHISAYNLTYEEGTALYNSMRQGKVTPLSEEENVEQFERLIDTLATCGYRQYEISNFALPGYESRHNSSYWHDIPYLGAGASAHSYDGDSRQWNIADIKLYIEGIENGCPDFEIEHLSTADKYNETILTRLRTADGIPLAWFVQKFGNKLYDYLLNSAKPHISHKKLVIEDDRLTLTKEGIFISDAIMRDLIYI